MANISDPDLLRPTLVMLLAGGQGEGLMPLTRDRAKAAVPFGGIYRIIDFTLGNCINSGLRRIEVLTQYKSSSLDRHLDLGWNIFSAELGEFIETIPPQQRSSERWYMGPADAIYQNIHALEREQPKRTLILAGDHVYRMDYRKLLAFHEEKEADVTIAGFDSPVDEGVPLYFMSVDAEGRVVGIEEQAAGRRSPGASGASLASMSIYVFRTDVLIGRVTEDQQEESEHDFARDVLPRILAEDRVFAYDSSEHSETPHAYWRSVATLDSYWEANMDLIQPAPVFDLYDTRWPIRTYQEQHPPARTIFDEKHQGGRRGTIVNSMVSAGCIISGAQVLRSVLSPNVMIDSHSEVTDSIVMEGVRIGRNVKIQSAIIDKGAVIPDDTTIGHDQQVDREHFTVTPAGIVVVPRETSVQS